jgi:hypothetical protein
MSHSSLLRNADLTRYVQQAARKTFDNILTIEWAGQKTNLVSPPESGWRVMEDDEEERMVSCPSGLKIIRE